MKKILVLIFISFCTVQIWGQTDVSGVITSDSIWTVSSSPYRLIGDVGVSAGVKLTIEPGVKIQFTGDYKIQVLGDLVAVGTNGNNIEFDNSNSLSSIMILFRKTNLSNSKISNVTFNGSGNAIQLALQTDYNITPKNSGVLNVYSCIFNKSSILTKGYETTASLLISNSQLDHSSVTGAIARSEPIVFKKSILLNSTIFSDSYNYGITIDSSMVKNCNLQFGASGAHIDLTNSIIFNSTMSEDNDDGERKLKVTNSKIIETLIDLPHGGINISHSITKSSGKYKIGYATITSTSLIGNNKNPGIEMTGDDGLSFTNVSISISNSTLSGNQTAINFADFGSVTMVNNNFINNSLYNIENKSPRNILAANNYWGTNNISEMAAKIYDGNDNLSYGLVNSNPALTKPDINAPISPPVNVTKSETAGELKLEWDANPEADIKGYKIYYGNFTGYSFANVIDAGNVTNILLPGISINDTVAVTAYDMDADNNDDQTEGHESWFSSGALLQPLSPVVLIAPGIDAKDQSATIDFNWHPILGAEKYQLQIAYDSLFISYVYNASNLSDTVQQVELNLYKHEYYWRVRSRTSIGNGPFSSIRGFTTKVIIPSKPQLLSPAINLINQPKNIPLMWNKVMDVDQYIIQLCKDSAFTAIEKDDSTTIDTSVVISDLLEGQKYYWRVRAKNSAGSSPWSDTWNFTTALSAPSNLELIRSGLNEVTLTWKDNINYEDGYIIERKQSPQYDFTFFDSLKTSGNKYIDDKVEQGQTYSYRIKAYTKFAKSSYSNEATLLIVSVENETIPSQYSIKQNYPNPFNPTTKIQFGLPEKALTKLTIYDVLGRQIEILLEDELNAGYHEVEFHAKNLPSGIYFYKIQANAFIQTRKLILIK